MANEESSPAIFSSDLGHIFGGDVRNDLGILLPGKVSHEPTFALRYCTFETTTKVSDVKEGVVLELFSELLEEPPFFS